MSSNHFYLWPGEFSGRNLIELPGGDEIASVFGIGPNYPEIRGYQIIREAPGQFTFLSLSFGET